MFQLIKICEKIKTHLNCQKLHDTKHHELSSSKLCHLYNISQSQWYGILMCVYPCDGWHWCIPQERLHSEIIVSRSVDTERECRPAQPHCWCGTSTHWRCWSSLPNNDWSCYLLKYPFQTKCWLVMPSMQNVFFLYPIYWI